MPAESKSFVPRIPRNSQLISTQTLNPNDPVHSPVSDPANWLPVGLVYALITVAVWTPQGRFNAVVNLFAAFFILWFTVRGSYSARELGLTHPVDGAVVILGAGLLLVVVIGVSGAVIANLGPNHPVPWSRDWQYAVWALQQQFILQSFFYVRLESLLGSRRAVLAATLLFASAHIPSPALTVMSFIGGVFFCEMFRRYRNLYPLGLVHAALGLIIAASFPDRWLHHMRVGIGFLQYHP